MLAGCIQYESLLDGTLGLEDVALLNDALDVRDENERRYLEAKERENGR